MGTASGREGNTRKPRCWAQGALLTLRRGTSFHRSELTMSPRQKEEKTRAKGKNVHLKMDSSTHCYRNPERNPESTLGGRRSHEATCVTPFT